MKENEYSKLHDALETEYFELVPGGQIDDGVSMRPRVARVLRPGKSRSEFDNLHAALSMQEEEQRG